mmetsp:Transcript_42205/g.88213  ORF Transcript_42205/g.88213 Transcript_42205/m.88213 type:complete len:86 (-) Transcript_42205:376-633(-)
MPMEILLLPIVTWESTVILLNFTRKRLISRSSALATIMSVAATYKNMGCVEDELGNFENALELYEKALEIELKSLGPAHASCERC